MDVRKKPETKNQAERGRKTDRARSAGPRSGRGREQLENTEQTAGRPDPEGYQNAGGPTGGIEKELKQALERLETYQTVGRRQRAFLAMQTHQLRAQLHVVMGYTELVLRKTRNQLPASQAENLKKLLQSAEGLKAAIEGLAEFPWADPEKSPSRKRA